MDFQQKTEEKLQRLVSQNKLSPLKAIRIKCLDCMGYQPIEVVMCPCSGSESTLCSLFQFRFGKKGGKGSKRSVST